MTEDYRPPVPPHRNIGVSPAASSPVDAVPPRKHHHHHHHNSKHQEKEGRHSQIVRPTIEFDSPKKEFEDAPPSGVVQVSTVISLLLIIFYSNVKLYYCFLGGNEKCI